VTSADPVGALDRPRLAFLGPEGTFAHAALRTLSISVGAALLPLATVTQAVDAVRAGEADGALVPLENSVEGAVPATLDELAGPVPLVIAEETYLPVVFDLMARPGVTVADVKTVATHPHAEAQVRRWLLTNLPDARVTLVGSTAGGARAVADGDFDAAVAPPVAADIYRLTSIATDIADNRGAVTRFVLLTKPTPPPLPSGNDRTTIMATLRTNHSGALLEILTEFATRAVNLTRIESRPTKERIGQYSFSIDCEGHINDERVGDAVAALRRICGEVRYLGSYPRRDGAVGPVVVGRLDADFSAARDWLDRVRTSGAS
jgi:prephenate dehydratase